MPKIDNVKVYGIEDSIKGAKYPKAVNVDKLNSELTPGIHACLSCPTGQGHDTALNGIVVQFDLTFSQNAWQQLQRYHFVDFVSSQSKMHKITKLDLKKQCNRYVDERIIDIVQSKIDAYNYIANLPVADESTMRRRKEAMDDMYLRILYNIPCGYELTARMTTNYRQLKTIYQQRRNHRLVDWQVFCDWIETLPRWKEIVE